MKGFFAIFCAFFLVFVAIFSIQGIYSFLFPIKYEEQIATASQVYDVDEAIIFSCINVESRFKKDAVSSKGAVGLMQILPSTANEFSDEDVFDLTDAKTNIMLGTKYLSYLIDRFGGLETALCAYNAGPTTVAKWLIEEECSDDGVTLKKIPYSETENYIKKFQKNLKYYSIKLQN